MRYIILIIAFAGVSFQHVYAQGNISNVGKITTKEAKTLRELEEEENKEIIIINQPYVLEPTSNNYNTNYTSVNTYYATDRNIIYKSGRPDYGVNRSTINYGNCRVSIPLGHKRGNSESPSLLRLEFNEDPTKHISLVNIDVKSKSNLFSQLNSELSKTFKKNVFIFIHGYNMSFGQAAQRTAQLFYDLKFKGIPIFYSWPSQESYFKYSVDEDNCEWSTNNFKLFLTDLLVQIKPDNVYLIAHSMGNRMLANSLVSLLSEQIIEKNRIREIVFVAPDIDSDIFKRDIAPAIASKNKQISLYVSSKDKALVASKFFNGNLRVGDAGKQILVVPGIETIDASNVDTGILGHSYFNETRSVIEDLFNLINNNLRADKRSLLEKQAKNGTYWEFSP